MPKTGIGMGTPARSAYEYRWPWYWLVVLAALAIAGTVAISMSTRSRLHAIEENFASGQMLRLQRVEHRIDDYFASANQLTMASASLSEQTIGRETLVRWLFARLYQARHDKEVYGVGVFYAPYMATPRARLVNIYDHAAPHGRVTEVVYHGDGRGPDNYPAIGWYRAAVKARGRISYFGPYVEDGRSFISVVEAFYQGDKVAGVVAVDTLTKQFREMLATGTGPGDVAWVSTPRDTERVSTAAIPSDPARYRDESLRLSYSHATLHLSSDAQPLTKAHGETIAAAIVSIATLWVLAFCTAIVLMGRWHATGATQRLRAEQARLEDEIAVAKRIESELRKAAYTDALTSFPNRPAFLETATGVLAGDRSTHAVFLVDLDRFNITNETLGHPAGDELLRILAGRLSAFAGSNGFVARLGGDEFVLLLPCLPGNVDATADAILRVIAEPAVLYGRTIYPHASIGIAVVDESYGSAEELLRDADIAMYSAKHRGRARSALFDTEMRRQVALDAELELDLRRAIERGEIVPHYQPIVELATGSITSFEALARWHRGDRVLSGAEFVPFSEKRGFVYQIDAAVQRSALSQAASVLALFPGSSIAFNVSAPELTSPLFAERLRSLLNEYRVEPSSIRLEITETMMMTRADEAHKTLTDLSELGVSVVLDDFGTGYSSLSYLQRLPISGVKIDRSFVERIDADERSREIVRSIVALTRVLGLTTTAEGVERQAQVDALAMLGVTYGQGFFFSPALIVSRLAEVASQPGLSTAATVE